jgi:hypothetical protein
MKEPAKQSESEPVTSAAVVEDWPALVKELRGLIESQTAQLEVYRNQVKSQAERIAQLEEEVRGLKKLKGRPKLQASRLEKGFEPVVKEGKRAGSAKRSKKADFEAPEERIMEPADLPAGSEFKGYRDYDVQELVLKRVNIRFKLAEYLTPSGQRVVGEVPPEYRGGHYGPELRRYVLAQHYQCRVTQPVLHEHLQDLGLDISAGQVNRILTEQPGQFETEQQAVLRVGLAVAEQIQVDDTTSRHQGKNGVCTVLSHPLFTHFESTGSKSRENFLKVLQGQDRQYVLNEASRTYVEGRVSAKTLGLLPFGADLLATRNQDWEDVLTTLGITTLKARRDVTEAALLGGLAALGLQPDLRILSDGARQFQLLHHALCWIHAERPLRKLEGETDQQRANLTQMRTLLWDFYHQLKRFQQSPSESLKATLKAAFEQIFGRRFEHHDALNQVLFQFSSYQSELLLVLDFPSLPLHNNAAETDIREFVVRRKISGGTRSEPGRRARDIFIGLKKTCRKLGISFWQFLGSRLMFDLKIPPLPELIRAKNALLIAA